MTSVNHDVPASPTRSRGRALAVLASAQFLVVLTTSIVNVALPQVRAGLGLSPAGLSWVVNGYVLLFGALLLVGGRLGDVYGLRRVFLTGLALFAAATLVAGLATGPAVLIAARAGQGVGAALLAPTALALVLVLFPAGRARGTAMGVWGAVSGAGGAAGVLLGGLLSGALGWRAVFFVTLPVAAVLLPAAWLWVAADRPRGGSVGLVDALTVTGGLVSLTYGLSTWGGGAAWTFLSGGVVLLAVFVVRQLRGPDPLVPPRVLVVGRVGAANVLMGLLGAVWVGLFFFLPLYQQKTLGYGPIRAGLTQLPLALSITALSWATPRLDRVLPRRVVLAGGLVALTAGLAWLSRAPADGTFLGDLLGPSLLIGSGLGVAFVELTTLSSAGVAAQDSGLAGGLVNATRQVGGACGLAVLTALAAAAGYGAAFTAAALTAALTTLLSLAIVRS
ncbi:MFS transporter [Dactylosporangium sp. CA-139066]|uniref:MFS transporter n=1 Tax=Dactylosporangium sp. CA-139066 TaxID=3239930 RepID=UPI003D8AB014